MKGKNNETKSYSKHNENNELNFKCVAIGETGEQMHVLFRMQRKRLLNNEAIF